MSLCPWSPDPRPADRDEAAVATDNHKSPHSLEHDAAPQDDPKPHQKRASEQSSAELRYPRKRSIRACHLCRARKTKCDNIQPTCGFCSSIGAKCSYDGKQHDHSSFDSASLEILRKLSELADGQNELIRLLRSSVANASHSPQRASPSAQTVASLPVALTPGSSAALRRDYEPIMAATSPAAHSDPSFSSLDRLVQASVGSSALPLRDTRESISGISHSHLSPQEYYEFGSDAAAARGNPAALRWFDLLASDAGRQTMAATPSQSDLVQDRRQFEARDESEITPLQQATRIIDDEVQNGETSALLDRFTDPSAAGTSRRLLEKRLWQAADDIPLITREQILFDVFVHQISSVLDLFDPRRTFSAVVSRLALRNAGLMNAVLAVSCHYASVDPESNAIERNDHHTPLKYYDQTLHYVQKAMRYSSYQTSQELLATTLTISIYEMLTGSRKDWDRHLQGVFWILRSQKINVETDGVESAVWWAWLRQDIWAAFREKRRTYTTWHPTKSYAELSPHEHATRAIWIMAQVVSFCCFDSGTSDGQIRMVERLERARQLHQLLDEWNRHVGVEYTPLPTRPHEGRSAFRPISIYPSCFGIATQVHYVSKILLCINEPCLGGTDVYLERLHTVQSWIRVVCGIALTMTDNASSMMCSQCLFIAGLFAQDDRERESILVMLDSACEKSPWWAESLGDDLRKAWSQAPYAGANSWG